MKIIISKSQWNEIGKKTGWMRVAEEISYQDLYQKYLQEGKTTIQAAEELLGIMTNGGFDMVEEPKRTQMINQIINRYPKETHFVEVTFNDGDKVRTSINGTKEEVEKYYLTNEFTKNDESGKHKGVKVEFIK
jgi:hypothetical protein